jgi:PAS domain S-box-containing protein
MLAQLRSYLNPPVFPGDEERTFTANLLHVILWSLLVGICLYTFVASVFAIIQPHRLLAAWLYVIAVGALAVSLMLIMRRGYVRFAAIALNVGFWIILTVAAYSNGGVAAPAYSGYLIVIICTCLLVSWQWGLAAALASILAGLFFLQMPLPDWAATYSYWSVWSANVAYFFVTTMLLALALRAIKRASQQARAALFEQQKTQQALSHSEQRFRAIFDAVNDAIFVQDLSDGRILDVNQKMCEMYGYTVEEARQLLVGDLSSGSAPYTQQAALAWMQQAASGEPQIFEWLAKDRAGRLFWVEVNMRRAAIDGQDRLLVVVRNIDDRKRVEETLHREQLATRQIAEAALLTPTLEEFYRAVHATVRSLVPADNFYIALYDAARDQLSVPYLADEFDRSWEPYAPGKGLSAYILRTGEPLLVTPEILAELEQKGEAEILNRRMAEWLGVPLKTAQGLLGVMAVQNYSGPVRLNEKHKDLLVFVSAQVAMAIERKRAAERERRFGQGLRAIIEAAQELMDCADLDVMYRRGVELAREKLGLERCGLFVLDEHATYLRGTYGTDDQGRTVDEHQAQDPISPERHRELFATPDRLWTVYERPLTYWQSDAIVHLPQPGWNVGTVIRSRHRTIGVLYNDAGLTQAPVNETQQDLTAVYASLLGSLLDLKRAEMEVAHERDLLQALMDNFPDTIYFKDTASRFTRINRAQANLLGIATPEQAIGKSDADFFRDSDLAHLFLAEEQQLMSSGEPIIDRVEYNPTPDGRPRWLSASKVPLRDAAGQIVGMVGVSRDITDRMLAEQREKTISQGLRAAIEAADELIGCADLDTLYRRAVELAREKLEVERCGLFMLDEQGWLRGAYGTDMQRQTTDERGAQFPPVNAADFDAAANQLWTVNEAEQTYWDAAQQQVVGTGWIASTFIRTRERIIGVLYNDTAITHAPVDEARQEVLAVYCSLLGSLIELKRAEEAMRESEALYRRAIEAAGAVPYYLDYPSESYRFMGEGILAMTGLKPAEMQPLVWNDLILEAGPLGQTLGLSWQEAVHETRSGHVNEWRCDYRIRGRDGVERWITDASIQVLDEQGQPRGAIGILQDISDRKQVELALRESEATTRALLDAIPDAIFRFDAHGVCKEYIPARDVAPLLPPDEFIGRPYAAVMPPVIVEQLDLNLRQVLEEGGLRSYEYPLSIADEERYFEARLVKMAQGDVLDMVRDVTDRKRAELALQQREAFLRSIFDNFPYRIWLKDTDGRYLAANRTLARSLGWEQVEDLIGKTDWDLTPTVAASFAADDRAVMESRTQKLVEEIVIDHGEEKWFETFKSPIFDAHGQVIGTAGFSHDITARRQAEAAIRESEALFRQLADNAPALIAMSAENGELTYLNRAWHEFRGDLPALPLDEWAVHIHPEDRYRYTHEVRSALHDQRKLTTEYRVRRVDGQYRWLLDTIVPRYAADERCAGFIGIAIDITDRKNAEEALRRSEGRLRLITDNMADSVSQVDAQQRLIYVSPSAERVYGQAVGDLLGRSLYEYVHPEDSARIYHQVMMAAELRAGSLRLEYRYRHAAGHYCWVESELRLLYDERGGFAGAVLGSRDISARKQIENEREKLIRELEDKNAELERFTYTVSHDLKSPLITIRGFLGFLEKDATSGNLDRLRADVARIAEATTRMQRLLDELLELSRIGRMTNAPEEVAFDQVAREAVELVQGRILARGVQVEIMPNLPVVYADRTRLVEAVQNLVDNAVKFMGDQPAPHITIGVLGAERAGMPIFFVEDNGLGIEPQYHERIFGLFNKLDAKSEGTGVGLALVKRIIDLHGGYIWVESDGAGRGATFFFTLPRPAAATNA